MKHFSILLSCMLLLNSIQTSTQDQYPHFYNIKKRSLYTYYFWMKEFCKFYISFGCLVDLQKVKKAEIACNQCNETIGSSDLYGYGISQVNELLLQQLMHAIYNNSTQELASFLQLKYTENQIQCLNCQKYNGWILIPEEIEDQQTIK